MGTLLFVLLLVTGRHVVSTVAAQDSDVPLAQPFDVKIGEQVKIAQEDLELGFADVVNDSRCPRDAQCFWQGVVTIKIWMEKKPASRQMFTLRAPGENEPVSYGAYAVSLKDVRPHPESNRRQRREDYVATLVVARVE